MTRESKFLLIFTVFVASLCVINIIASKIAQIGALTFPAGAYAYAVTFICTDVVSESWGRKRAVQMVWWGLVANFVVVGFVTLAVYHPAADFWSENSAAYDAVLGWAPRILLASVVAYTVSQFHDVWAFHMLKKRTAGKHLWLRSTASTVVSQAIDTVLFVGIAFYGVMSVDNLVWVMGSQYIIKVVIAVLDTPVVYAGVRWTNQPDGAPEPAGQPPG